MSFVQNWSVVYEQKASGIKNERNIANEQRIVYLFFLLTENSIYNKKRIFHLKPTQKVILYSEDKTFVSRLGPTNCTDVI